MVEISCVAIKTLYRMHLWKKNKNMQIIIVDCQWIIMWTCAEQYEIKCSSSLFRKEIKFILFDFFNFLPLTAKCKKITNCINDMCILCISSLHPANLLSKTHTSPENVLLHSIEFTIHTSHPGASQVQLEFLNKSKLIIKQTYTKRIPNHSLSSGCDWLECDMESDMCLNKNETKNDAQLHCN